MLSYYFLQVECGAAINIENVYNLTPLTLVGNIDFTGLRMIENGQVLPMPDSLTDSLTDFER